jgi:hypothetical protein
MLKPKNCQLNFLKKKSESKNLGFWLFPKLKETTDSVKEPAKNSRFLTVLWLFLFLKIEMVVIYQNWFSNFVSSELWDPSKCCPDNHQGFGSISGTHASAGYNLHGFSYLYSTSFARFYVIVRWGVMILPLVFMALIWRWNSSSLLSTIWCQKMATISR